VVTSNKAMTAQRNTCTRRVSFLAKPVDDEDAAAADDVDDAEEDDVIFGMAVVVVVLGMVSMTVGISIFVVDERCFDPFLDNVVAFISPFKRNTSSRSSNGVDNGRTRIKEKRGVACFSLDGLVEMDLGVDWLQMEGN